MRVLSLFDGMSCGQYTLNKLGIPVEKYYASEIDKYAIKIAKKNFPNTIHLGDVKGIDVRTRNMNDDKDLLLGGSPCQSFSFAGNQLNFDDPRGKLFFEFVRLKDKLKPKYFLLENVKMKKEYQDIITKYLGVKPIEINSKYFSAQNRVRLYWTNIPIETNYSDKGLVLQDILEEDGISNPLMNSKDDKAHCITARYNGAVWWNSIQRKQRTMVQVGETDNIKGFDIIKRIYSPMGKSPTLTTMQGGHREPKVAIGRIVNRRLDANGVRKDNQLELPFTKQLEIKEDGKTNCLTTFTKDNVLVKGMEWRKLKPLECERLQGLPDNYTEGVSNSQRYKMIGNGFTIPVIKHILKDIVFKDMTTISLFDGYSGCQQAIKELLEENKNESK